MEGRQALSDLDSELDRLYAAPLADFVTVRNEIATRLRLVGDDPAAGGVKALRKPSVSAWAVNQLVRTRELDVARLLKAGEALEQAQRDLLSGKAGGFETARKEEAAAIGILQAAAREMIPNMTAVTLERVTQSLRAGTSEARRAELKAGRLTEDLTPGGFEFAPDLALTTPRAGKEPAAKKAKEEAARLAAEAQDLERLANEAELEAKRARQRADAARKKADAAAAKARP